MRKKNKSAVIFMAAAVSVGLLVGCAGTEKTETETSTEVVTVDTDCGPSAVYPQPDPSEQTEGSDASDISEALDSLSDKETSESAEGMFIDLHPVSKWGYIDSVDEENSRINFVSQESYLVDEEENIYNDSLIDIVLHYTDYTPILDAETLMPVKTSDIEPSAPVYVWISQAMTMSMPPQTTAQAIIVNVPEDASAPMYVVAQAVENTDGGIIITDQDGVTWRADGDTVVTPYLTRNIVTLDDIKEGTRLIISQGSETSTSGTEKAGDADAYGAEIMIFAD